MKNGELTRCKEFIRSLGGVRSLPEITSKVTDAGLDTDLIEPSIQDLMNEGSMAPADQPKSSNGPRCEGLIPVTEHYSKASAIWQLPDNLLDGKFHFNPSIAFDPDGALLLSYRYGDTRLPPQYTAIRKMGFDYSVQEKVFELPPSKDVTIEDARMFWHNGELHLATTVVKGLESSLCGASHRIHLIKLSRGFEIVDEWTMPSPDGRPTEKNWQFFSYDRNLYFVHTIRPHQVYQVDFARHKYSKVFRTECEPWSFGEEHGGTPPVKIGNEYISVFHSDFTARGTRHYVAGVYAFETKPPFRIIRKSRLPIMVPSLHDIPSDWGVAVCFSCGLLRYKGKLIVSFGHHDSHCRIAEFVEEDLLGEME